MEGQKFKYQSINFFQDILLIFIGYFVYFLELIKRILRCFLPLDDDKKSALDSPSFKNVKTSPFPCTFDLEKDPNDDHDQFYETHETKENITSPVPNPTSSKTQERYKTIKLPLIIHDFPLKHYKYLPMFDGGLDKISTGKHIQGFEHFLDLFEVEHANVCLRAVSQYLQGDVK
jgi:hypothetical protein